MDGKGHAESKVDAATGKVTRGSVGTDEGPGEREDLLAAEVTAKRRFERAMFTWQCC
ncbi:hypothetical protein [Streptomyces laurentii]|uniref:hypothetical protein n=1 Tax=Streptomyces laurentii TaxID=39478 RepID=UPI00367707E4